VGHAQGKRRKRLLYQHLQRGCMVLAAHVVHTLSEVGGAITSAVDDNGPVLLLFEPEVRRGAGAAAA